MPFVKLVKNNAYFKRFQVKYARRRSGKTDYKARRAMLTQDKNKYQAPKHRLVVRLTNSTVIVQIVKSTWRPVEQEKQGDVVVAAAYSSELKNYGVKVGFKNYTAAYLTGYLAARRLLKDLKLDEAYKGVEEPDGLINKTQGVNAHTGKELKRKTYYVKELDDEKRPFRAFLDVGTRRATTGARIFGAMKAPLTAAWTCPTMRSASRATSRRPRSTTLMH
jgi:large subunit ribosomal protein L5e